MLLNSETNYFGLSLVSLDGHLLPYPVCGNYFDMYKQIPSFQPKC